MLLRFRGKSEALSRFHGFKSLCLYSTSARTASFVNYLIDSLGFSKEEASLVSSKVKVTSWKSLKRKPDLVLNFLKQTGFDNTQMKKLVSAAPKFLFYDVSKTLKPKLQCLMDIGLSGWDLVNVIAKDSTIVERGLVTHLKPTINCLRRALGSDENVVKAIKRTNWLLSFGGSNVMETNLLLLKKYGVSDEKIQKLVLRNPRYITQKPEWVKDLLHRVEKDFQIPLDSSMFPYGFQTLASQKKARCEKKIEIFRSFGWSDDDILTMFRKLPYCIALSENKIQKGLSLYMKELGFKPAYLASHPSILVYSMEKRVIPRMKVLKILDEKKLERRKVALYTVVSITESKFIEYFVLPYKDQVSLNRASIVNSLPTITRWSEIQLIWVAKETVNVLAIGFDELLVTLLRQSGQVYGSDTLLQFLLIVVDNYDIEKEEIIIKGVTRVLSTLVKRGVVGSLDVD